MKKIESFILPIIIIVAAAGMRLIPHLPNFAPIGAMALFGGTYLNRRWALILPLAAMVLSDLFLGFDSIPSRLTVYGSFLAIVGIGFWLKAHKNLGNIIAASLASSLLFFLVTNFGVWAFGSLYAKTVAGLYQSFLAGIPFFRSTVAGDFFYTGVFFGSFALIKSLLVDKRLASSKIN